MPTNHVLLGAATITLFASLAVGCERTPRESSEQGQVATADEKTQREELELREREVAFAEVKRAHLKTRSQASLAAADTRTASLETRKKQLAGGGLVEVKSALESVAAARATLTDEIAKLADASPRELTSLGSSVEKAESELAAAVTAYEAALSEG